jgi:hypothetical protein
MAITAVTGFTESFSDTHPFYRGTYFKVVARSATGSGNGSASVAHTNYEQRLGQLTDFSFPYRFGGRFYLGVRAVLTVTATASGLGTASSEAQVLRQRQGTGSGVGSETAIRIVVVLRSATGSGVGTMDSTGLHIAPRTASDSGVGSQSATGKITPVRTAVGSGLGDSVVTFIRVPLRTATGSGEGSGEGVDLVINIRTAIGSGVGDSVTLGGILYFRSATGSGQGTDSADWVKSHIFRVPYTYNYPGATYRDEGAANRLQRYNRTNVRVRNLYKLTNGSYTTVDQRDQGQVAKLWQGGHDHYLTDAEVVELTTAGFGASIT